MALGDAQLSALIARAPAQPAEIARIYIDLRAQQTALVVLARREEIDRQLIVAAPQNPRIAAGSSRTRADQARTRARIAALRRALAALDGLEPHALDDMPGGPIPLPPAASATRAEQCRTQAAPDATRGAQRAIHHYDTARKAAALAQLRAEQASASAAAQDLSERAGTIAPTIALIADRHALDALLTEAAARAAMTGAFVGLAGLGRHNGGAP